MILDKMRQYLHYLPEQGIFVWIKAPERKPFLLSKEAGILSTSTNRWYIKFEQKSYARSILAWAFTYNKFPMVGETIDHINHDTTDDKMSNLRKGTYTENLAARRLEPNKTGFRGVSEVKANPGLYRARLGKRTRYTRDLREAAKFYNEMASQAYGEFATLNFVPE